MRLKEFFRELKHHVPFTLFATVAAILLILFFKYFLEQQITEFMFELSHVLHIVVSSFVTAGIYYKYNKKLIPALLVGIFGAIIIGSISDIIFPWLGGNILGLHMHFHLPVIEVPAVVLGATIAGSILGIKTGFTKLPHFIHVFLSVFASLFYLLTFSGAMFELTYFAAAFFIVFISVIIPCCVSDILFPFFFIGNRKEKPSSCCCSGRVDSDS